MQRLTLIMSIGLIFSSISATADLNITVEPTDPTVDDEILISVMNDFPDPGHTLVDATYSITDHTIDVQIIMVDLHEPGSVWPPVITPDGGTVNVGTLEADEYVINASMFMIPWGGTVPEFLDSGIASFNVSSQILEISLDIKPRSCPNPVRAGSKGVLPVAILGTEDFDVTTIDITSITLAGVSPIRYNLKDVATPLDKESECECWSEGPDGFMDLILKFKKQEIIAVLGDLSLLPRRCVIPLTLSCMTMDGEVALEGTDCIVLKVPRRYRR